MTEQASVSGQESAQSEDGMDSREVDPACLPPGPLLLRGPLSSFNSHHRRTPELVL